MMSHDPKRLSRVYLSHLLWLVEYGSAGDLAMVPPAVRVWVRDIRASLFLPASALWHTTAPTTHDLLATLLGERSPLL